MGRLFAVLILLLFLLLPGAQADIVINEVMASNGSYQGGHAYDWVELYNNGEKTVDLSGWHFSDSGKEKEKFTFPSGTKLKKGQYLVIWCTGEEGQEPGAGDEFYAPFRISASGEKLYLTDAGGAEVKTLKLPQQYGTVSYGLPSGGGIFYGFLEHATRGAKNDASVFDTRVDTPEILTSGGFYDSAVTVLAAAPAGATLRYTLDGSTPTAKSKKFPFEGLKISKTAVLRVRAFAEDAVSSQTVSASYFIKDRQVTPVVSLVTDSDYMFGSKAGALVKGTGKVPNYDKPYEYPVNIEYFDAEGVCRINQIGSFTCNGHSARVNSQKSIALHARSAWGEETFDFNPFPNRNYTSYKALLLRGANSDAHATRIRDIVASSLAEGQGIYYQDYVIVQVYINGEYWGHYNLREKINKYSIAQWEGVTDKDQIDQIDILERTGTDEFTRNGHNEDWIELADFCRKNDLNDPDNLQHVIDRVDVDTMFTHAAFQIILGNVDFTNVLIYRVPGSKWKYALFDVEACWRNLEKSPLEYYIKPVTGKIQGFRHEPLNALLAVPEYKARFLTRVAEVMEQCFQWSYVESRFNEVLPVMEEILPRHISRWKNMKLSDWKTNIGAIEYYARVRPRKVPELLRKAMKLTKAEVETYFGDVLALLEVTNAKPK